MRLTASDPLANSENEMSTAICLSRPHADFSELHSPEDAGTLMARSEAIRTALSRGVPLHEIEADLDWLDAVRDSSPAPRESGWKMA
jgi:hypothetical protein